MERILEASSFFGFGLTLLIFGLAVKIRNKTGVALLNPIITASAMIIILLLLMDIDYTVYEAGAGNISFFLTPATVCYGVPLYRQLRILKNHLGAVFAGTLCGCLSSAGSVWLFARLFHVGNKIYLSLLPKSVTTAIGMVLSKQVGGIPAVTVGAVMITGLTGAIIAPGLLKILRITEPAAQGLAIGTASHAIGTSKAFEMGQVQGAASSLAIVVSGLFTVVLVQLLV